MLQAAPPIEFPASPWIETYLFQSPWLLMALLIALGVGGFVVLTKVARPRWAGGILAGGLVFAAAAYAISALVETTGERLQAQTRTLIDVVSRADGDAAGQWLEDGAVLEARPYHEGTGRAAIVNLISTQVPRYDIRTWDIGSLRSTIDGPEVGRTLMRLTVEPEAIRAPYASWWVLTWRRGADGTWRVWTIRLLDRGAWR